MIASPAKASGHRCPKGLVSRKVSWASGRSFVSERGAPQAGQVTVARKLSANVSGPRQRRLLAHADRRTLDIFAAPYAGRSISADWPAASTNVIVMSVIGSQRSFSG